MEKVCDVFIRGVLSYSRWVLHRQVSVMMEQESVAMEQLSVAKEWVSTSWSNLMLSYKVEYCHGIGI